MTDPREFNRLADRLERTSLNDRHDLTAHECLIVATALRTAAAESGAGAVKAGEVVRWEWLHPHPIDGSDIWRTEQYWNGYTSKTSRPLYAALIPEPAKAGDSLDMPPGLHPKTAELVRKFAVALAKKLRLAEEKYGYGDSWSNDRWEADCRDHLYQHLDKGDPRDVAAYCAFMWHHGWITARPAKAGDAVLLREVLATCRDFIRGEQVENAVVCIGSMQSLGDMIDEALSSTAQPPRSVDIEAIALVLSERLQCISDDERCHVEITGIDEAARSIAEMIEELPPHPIAPAAPVSVDEVAAFLEPAAFYGNADDRHRYCSPLRIEVVQERTRERARALLDAFKMERK